MVKWWKLWWKEEMVEKRRSRVIDKRIEGMSEECRDAVSKNEQKRIE